MKNIRFIYIVTLIFSIFLISDVYALSVGRVVSNSEINIREKASVTGKITGGLKYNDEIILYNNKTLNPNKSCTMGWYKIKYKDNIGYVCSNYISKSINTATIISKKKISIKSKPNISSKTYKRINNKTVTLLSTKKYKGKGCSNGWYKINYDGYTKYVCSSYVTSRNNSSTVITTNRNKTKLYNKFSTSKRNFISVKYGTPLTLISKKLYKGKNCSSGYYKISYSKQIRYVCSKNVLITNKVSVVDEKNGAIIRKYPDENSKQIGFLNYFDEVIAYSKRVKAGKGCLKEWYKVKYGSKTGYICSDSVSNLNIVGTLTKNSNVMTGKSNNTEVITTINKNSKVLLYNYIRYNTYHGCSVGWYKVNVNNKIGYVCSDSIDFGEIKENATKIPILTFHRIVDDNYKKRSYANDEWTADKSMFEKQMNYLYINDYNTLSLDEFYKWWQGKLEVPKKTVAITFDDGNSEDYFIVMPILKKYNFKATSFIVGSRITDDDTLYDESERRFITKPLMQKMKEEYPNIEFQSHSYDFHKLTKNNKYQINVMSEKEIQQDFDENAQYGFKYIAYPYGIYNENLLKKVKKNNYLLGFGFRNQGYATKNSPKYEMPRVKINSFSDLSTMNKWLNY